MVSKYRKKKKRTNAFYAVPIRVMLYSQKSEPKPIRLFIRPKPSKLVVGTLNHPAYINELVKMIQQTIIWKLETYLLTGKIIRDILT